MGGAQAAQNVEQGKPTQKERQATRQELPGFGIGPALESVDLEWEHS
jgi:hypothetical protein